MDPPLDSRQGTINANAIAFTTVSCVCFLLRIYSRYLSAQGWWWDDVATVIAWCIVMTNNGIALASIHYGLGAHLETLGPSAETATKLLYLDQVFVHPSIAACKFIVILFYARIFTAPVYQRALWVVGGVTAAWLVGTLPAVIFNCTPIKKAWLGPLYPEGHCIDLQAFFVGQAIPNTLLDVTLLLLPLSFVWRLNMNVTGKIALSSVFCLGIFETAASIARLIFFIKLGSDITDPTYQETESELWSRIEVNVGFICACLMAAGPLVKHIRSLITTSLYGKGSRKPSQDAIGASKYRRAGRSWATKATRTRIDDDDLDFERLSSNTPLGHNAAWDTPRADHRTDADGGEWRGGGVTGQKRMPSGDDIRLDEIHVTKDVYVSHAQVRP